MVHGQWRLIFDFGVCGREDLCPILSSVQFFPSGSLSFVLFGGKGSRDFVVPPIL